MKRMILAMMLLCLSSLAAAGGDDSDPFYLLPLPDAPTVALRLLVRVGSVDDPAGREGLCRATMRAAVEGGTAELTQTEVQDRLYPMATSVDLAVDREMTIFTATVRREDLAEFYPIFWGLVVHPRFDDDDVRRVLDTSLSTLRNELRGGNDEWLKEVLQSALYRGTAWEHPTLGTEAGLSSITPDDIRAFHRSTMTRGRIRIGIAGGFDAGFAERVRADLAELPPGGSMDLPTAPSLDPIHGTQIILVDKKAPATAISIGSRHSITRSHPDYYPLLLAMTAFGEHRTFFGRLQKEMRSIRGLNYGDYAYLEYFEQDGWSRFPRPNVWRGLPYFSIWIRPVQPENGPYALRHAIWELRRLVDDGLTEQEFQSTRDHMRNVSQLWAQTLQRRLGVGMDDRHFGREPLVTDLSRALDSMRLDDVNAALKRHLSGTDLIAVMVCADADSLKGVLMTGAGTPITYSGGDAPPEIRTIDMEIAILPITVDPVTVVPVDRVYR